ncbi:MAG TPA: RT0821/Lpp0805 family surface protein [Burkholderiales bacterium]|nr:RT0821/Lpp0805 family surface protein [Burkholderiales bacterium]
MKNIAAAAVVIALAVVASPSPAQPPDHAKAHGWRKKNDPTYVGYTGKKWEKDYGIAAGRCNSAEVGAVLGGVTGAVVGSRVAERENRTVAVIAGGAIGAVIGAKIGQAVDDADRGCMGHALELGGAKKTVVWTNETTGVSYRLTPTRDFKQGREACREFTTMATKGKKEQSVKGVACRHGDGQWEVRS